MRHFRFSVDNEHNKRNNEFSRDASRLQLTAGVFGTLLMLIAVGLYLFFSAQVWALALAIGLGSFALFCFALIFILPRQMGSPQQMFDQYPLVPAMIAEVLPRGMVLMALVDANASESGPAIPALAIRNITRLQGHEAVVGERVPAVAVSGRRSVSSTHRWDEISPMPIAWGTPNSAVIQEAERDISEKEWQMLTDSLGRLEDVKETPMNLLVL